MPVFVEVGAHCTIDINFTLYPLTKGFWFLQYPSYFYLPTYWQSLYAYIKIFHKVKIIMQFPFWKLT